MNMLPLFSFFFLIIFLLFLAGLKSPAKLRLTRLKTRKDVLVYLGIPCIGCLILISALAPNRNRIKQKEVTITTPKNVEDKQVVSLTDSIEVVLQMIKKIDNKFRYFFVCKNLGETDFLGDIKIELETVVGLRPIGESFSNISIPSRGGRSFYLDGSTGTPYYHGQNGINKFNYNVSQNDQSSSMKTVLIPDVEVELIK